jgi:hypothetical protein
VSVRGSTGLTRPRREAARLADVGERARHRVAVEPRQADVDERHVAAGGGAVDAGGAVFGERDLVPFELEQLLQGLADVGVVLDHQDVQLAPHRPRALARGGVVGCAGVTGCARWAHRRQRRLQLERARQRDHELAAAAEALGEGEHLAAVQLHQPLDQRQPDAEAADGAIDGLVGLREQLEHARQHLGAHADAVVAHADDRFVLVGAGSEADVTAAVGVLGGVVEQVR